MILVFHHCGLFIISNMEFLFSWVTNLYICIAQLENIPIKSVMGNSINKYHQICGSWHHDVPCFVPLSLIPGLLKLYFWIIVVYQVHQVHLV